MAIAKQTEHLARKMESRHIQMISLGGVIDWYRAFLELWLYDPSSRPFRNSAGLFRWRTDRLQRHALSGRAFGSNALYRFVSRVCQALYQPSNRLCRRHSLLADLDDCARF